MVTEALYRNNLIPYNPHHGLIRNRPQSASRHIAKRYYLQLYQNKEISLLHLTQNFL